MRHWADPQQTFWWCRVICHTDRSQQCCARFWGLPRTSRCLLHATVRWCCLITTNTRYHSESAGITVLGRKEKQLTLVNVHQAKRLEFNSVLLDQDFKQGAHLTADDLPHSFSALHFNVLYVALSRPRKLCWFDDVRRAGQRLDVPVRTTNASIDGTVTR